MLSDLTRLDTTRWDSRVSIVRCVRLPRAVRIAAIYSAQPWYDGGEPPSLPVAVSTSTHPSS